MAAMSWAARAAAAAGAPEPPPPANTRLQAALRQQAAETAQYQPTGEAEALFLSAVDQVFARWSLLRLAVEMGWGDGDPVLKTQLLKEEVLAWLQKRRASQLDPSELEELLQDIVNEDFHVLAEDGSPKEVAMILVQMFQQCAVGDLTATRAVLSQVVPGAGKAAAAYCTAGAEPEEFDADMSDSDDEGAGGGGGEGATVGGGMPTGGMPMGGFGMAGPFGGPAGAFGGSFGGASAASGGMDDDGMQAQPPALVFAAPAAAAAAAAPVDDGWTVKGRAAGRRGR